MRLRSTPIKAALILFFCLVVQVQAPSLSAQLPDPAALAPSTAPNPLSDTTVNPGKVLLFELEAKFAKDVLARGGAAFADWFAEDGVALGNGQQPAIGRVAIMKSSNWDPKLYQLTWTPTEAVLGPSGDIGYTWDTSKATAKTPTATPSPPLAATSPSGANSPTAPGRSSSTPAPTSPPPPATAAKSRLRLCNNGTA